ncbi:MAG: endonuclease/exonuclease/phosphatase family protein [Alphaproteobacteria bacterium]|nr:endonuclease/exonuclease/phosphatase family protein [Alphaproteobacteria bacterium]
MTLSFRLASFNLENLDTRPDHSGGARLDDRLKILRPQIERLDADILCLQEVNAEEIEKHGERRAIALERLIEGTGYHAFHLAVSRNRAGLRMADRHNLAILSRFPILEERQIWHQLVPAPLHFASQGTADPQPVEWDRPFLYARIDLNDCRILHVLNLHLKAPRAAFVEGAKETPDRWKTIAGWAEGYYIASIKRTGQALEARLQVEALFDADSDALIAVAGDLNADDNETPLKILRAEADDTGNAHLAARSLISLERGLPEAQRFSVIHHGRPALLDHLLVSRPLLGWNRDIAIHNEALGDEAISPTLTPATGESYHAPLVASFKSPTTLKP